MHMKSGITFWSGLGVALILASLPASAADLLSIYDQAVVNDPDIREANATRLARRESRPQAMAALLPQFSASAGTNRSWSSASGSQEIFPGDPNPTIIDSRSSNSGTQLSLNLRQNVFSWQNWVALRSADHQMAQAEADYLSAQQLLAQRVATQYFAVLQAQDRVEAQEAARNAISRQLEQAERRFEVGLIAITDVQEARAERDTAAAAVIAAKRALASAEEQLRAIIGQKPAALNEPSEDMPLLVPNPASEDDWVRTSMDQNATLISSRLAADIAREAVSSAFGGHLPSIDLTASRTYSDNDGDSRRRDPGTGQYTAPIGSGSENNSRSIALQFSIPLFSGGLVSSRERQTEQQWIAAKERLERASRNTERQARYLG
jgi:outer membrane protein